MKNVLRNESSKRLQTSSRSPGRATRLSIGVSLVSAALAAHDTWLLPTSMTVAPGSTVTLDLTSGMDFPAPEAAVKPDRLASARCRLAGKVTDISGNTLAEKSLQLRFRAQSAGIATVWAESRPRSLDLEPAEVKEYLEEIGATETVGRDWAKMPEPRKWRETYSKHTKTFVRIGSPAQDRSWAEPTGMTVEIIPDIDPTALVAGTDFPVRLLFDGRPLAGLSVGIVAAGQKAGPIQKTDADGRVSFRLDRAGWFLLRATQIARPDRAGGEWVSHFATLTVEAGAP